MTSVDKSVKLANINPKIAKNIQLSAGEIRGINRRDGSLLVIDANEALYSKAYVTTMLYWHIHSVTLGLQRSIHVIL